VADLPSSGSPRVFVSRGATLYRQYVLGSGQRNGGANGDYTMGFNLRVPNKTK
jgi:hypothetical protein